MKLFVFDTESTTHSYGNPFSQCNKLCSLGWYNGTDYTDSYAADCGLSILGLISSSIQEAVDEAELIVAFNAKFDMHWGRRIALDFSHKRVWDVQLAHFMLTYQKVRYPSLNGVCEYYGLPQKLDVVKEEYWDKGINTDKVPKQILLEYMKQDIMLTYQCYLRQVEDFKAKPKLYRLFQIHCMDLVVLAEMEWNGLRINVELCAAKTAEIHAKTKELETRLYHRFPDAPINWDSGEHMSAILYGGNIVEEYKEQIGYFKSGQKIGLPRFANKERLYEFTGLFKPVKGSELKKKGIYSTDEDTLKQLKGNKSNLAIVSDLLERAKLTKLLDYYEGWPNLILEKDWPQGEMHGQFNQIVVATGRLSSSEPNQQNVAADAQNIIVSRYS